jgi:hypothetical protein
MTLDTLIIIICAVGTIGSYIYLRATNNTWSYTNWKFLKKHIFRAIYRFACKMSK